MQGVGAAVEVERIGLTMAQIREAKAPPNPAKETDKRYKNYVLQHGATCWELDALTPEALEKLYQDYFLQYTDMNLYHAALKREQEGQRELIAAYSEWDTDQYNRIIETILKEG